jgi:hypothetical protein
MLAGDVPTGLEAVLLGEQRHKAIEVRPQVRLKLGDRLRHRHDRSAIRVGEVNPGGRVGEE